MFRNLKQTLATARNVDTENVGAGFFPWKNIPDLDARYKTLFSEERVSTTSELVVPKGISLDQNNVSFSAFECKPCLSLLTEKVFLHGLEVHKTQFN